MINDLKKLLEYAPIYEKYGNITARPAVEGEEIVTYHSGEVETKNTAKAGDMVATGSKGEEYIIPCAKFPKLYESIGNDTFKPLGEVKAVMVPEGTPDFYFLAPWGEEMLAKGGDFICTSLADNFDPDQCYRIEKSAFPSAYQLKENQ